MDQVSSLPALRVSPGCGGAEGIASGPSMLNAEGSHLTVIPRGSGISRQEAHQDVAFTYSSLISVSPTPSNLARQVY